jgi:steroid delta-isomerase-like uncharacterized protein
MTGKEIASQLFGALSQGDVDAAMDLMAADAVIEVTPLRLRGSMKQEGRRFLVSLVTAFPDLIIDVNRSFEGDDGAVVCELKLQGTQAAPFFGVVNQEKHIDLDQAWVLHTKSGKVSKLKAFWCQNQLYRRLAVKRLDRIDITGALAGV